MYTSIITITIPLLFFPPSPLLFFDTKKKALCAKNPLPQHENILKLFIYLFLISTHNLSFSPMPSLFPPPFFFYNKEMCSNLLF